MVLISLLVILFFHKAACEFYIVPSEEYDCPAEKCFTLAELATNSSEYLTESSTVFITPGNHRLNFSLMISNIPNFTVSSNFTTTSIECTETGHLTLKSINTVVLKGLHFNGCQENIIQSVGKCIVESCHFESSDARKTVLHVTETSLLVEDTSFISNYLDGNRDKINLQSSSKHGWLLGGAVLGIHSNITLNGHTSFVNFSQHFAYGGALAIFQSNMFFNGVCEVAQNHATNGGAIYAAQSEIFVNGELYLNNNKAEHNGGGIYLDQSELKCNLGSITKIMGNYAVGSGGGIYADSSSIKMTVKVNQSSLIENQSVLKFIENKATQGGALLLSTDSKLYVLEHVESLSKANQNSNECFVVNTMSLSFTSNTADYGGAVYVDDSNSDRCGNTLQRSILSELDCFYQVTPIHSFSDVEFCTNYFDFSRNTAKIAGSDLFGGQLDRCTTSPFSRVQSSYRFGAYDGLTFLEKISSGLTLQSISSHPVRLCHCNNNNLINCSHWHDTVTVQKGQDFMIQVIAIDQVGHPVNSTIQGRLTHLDSDLSEGQVIQTGVCTSVTFSVSSQNNAETLLLTTSSNPCNELQVDIQFLPCTCPIGFQPSDVNTKQCLCQCHSDIHQYVECNLTTKSFSRLSNVWISDVTYGSNNMMGYLIFPHCPFDYCNAIENNESINLNLPKGSDAQCTLNRTGLLCGSCPPDLSLSLGTTRCLLCPSYWPALFVSISLAAILAGIALVTIVLVLNLTVAAGTVNALIFYANIVATHRSILLPFPHPNFITVFISWFNLELGIDTCYFEGMDAYSKTWLQFVFPTYIIILVAIIIILSTYSSRFSNLIGRKNPVAALATLVLLSYAKYLQTVIAIMVFGILRYPDGSFEVVWLHDPTVKYFVGKHSALFILAVSVLIIGGIYIFLLLSWQWLLRLSKWWIFRWINNVKLHALMEAYHAPFTSKYRFWPGLLLFVRACLCLIDALSASSNPQVVFTSITFTMGFLITLKSLIGNRIYKKWTFDVLEIGVLFNLLFFAIFMWYTFDTESNQAAIAYISVCITFILLLVVIVYHVYAYTGIVAKFHGKKANIRTQEVYTLDVSTDTFDTDYERPTISPPTYSVVESPSSS